MRYRNWEIRDFSMGYIDKLDDNLLPESASSSCQNFISKQIGSLKKRDGQARLKDGIVNMSQLTGPILGLYSYYYGNPLIERELVFAANGVVYVWDGTDISEINSDLDESQPILFETCANYMVAFSGLDTPWKYDGTAVTTLSNAPVDGKMPVLHKEQLFVVPVSDPSALYWSEILDPEVWPVVNFWPIKEGDGDKITNLQKFLGELIIFKGRSIHSLRGTSLSDFRLDEIDGAVGCVGPRAAAVHKHYIYFISDEGLMTFNGMKSTNLSQEIMPVLWDTINKEHLEKAVVGVWGGLVWFALPEGTSTTNNLVLMFDPRDGSSGSFWPMRGINISCMAKFDDGKSTRLFTGDFGGYVNEQNIGNTDFGTPINAFWVSKAFDFKVAASEKKARKIFVEDSPNTTNVVTVEASADGGTFNGLTYRTADRKMREYSFNSGVQWRRLKLKLIHATTGGCEVRGIIIPFRVKRRPRVKEAT